MPLIVGAWCECASEPKGCNEKSGVGMRPALAFVRAICCAHIRDHPTAPRSPRQNGYVERLIGSIRRECLDHIVVFGEAHLRRIVAAYATYYNDIKTHLALGKDAPLRRPIQRLGEIAARPILGGLHHEYCRM